MSQGSTCAYFGRLPPHILHLIRLLQLIAHFPLSSSLSKTSLSMERLPLPFQNFVMPRQLSFYATFFLKAGTFF
jgi:hypothetical protein